MATKKINAGKLEAGMKFRTNTLGQPGKWHTATRVRPARAPGYLVVDVEVGPWVSLTTKTEIEIDLGVEG